MSFENMARSTPRATEGGAPSTAHEGRWGIVVVLAAHINMALSVGFLRCCGVLYLSWKNEFDTSAKDTAVIQSIMSFSHAISGLVGGILTRRFGCRLTGTLGGALAPLGMLSSCWVVSITQLYVTASITGLGLGLAYIAAISAVAEYFQKRFKMANSVALSGCGTGIMAAPPMMQHLLEKYGWRGTMLVASAITANVIVCSVLFRPRAVQKERKLINTSFREDSLNEPSSVDGDNIQNSGNNGVGFGSREADGEILDDQDTSAGRKFRFTKEVASSVASDSAIQRNAITKLLSRIWVLLGLETFAKCYRSLLLCIIGAEELIPYMGYVIFIIPRAQAVGVAPSSAALLLTILGIGSLLGRLGHGTMISWRKLPAEGVFAILLLLAGISTILGTSGAYALLAASAFVQGFTTGALMGIKFCLTRTFVGLENFAVSSGWFTLFGGIGVIVGPIISGLMLDVTGSYSVVFYVLAGIYFMCTLQCLLFPLLKRLEPGIDTNNLQ